LEETPPSLAASAVEFADQAQPSPPRLKCLYNRSPGFAKPARPESPLARYRNTVITAPGFGKSANNVFDSNVYYGILKLPQDRNGWKGDPMLLGAGTAGTGRETASVYGLRPGSPAIDAGYAVSEDQRMDFFGSPVPYCSGIDRGAVESALCGQGKGKE
jgi:hypothetical protein